MRVDEMDENIFNASLMPLFAQLNTVAIVHVHLHLDLDDAEDQVPGNHLLQRHVLTGRISHTHLTRSRSEGPVCGARGAAAQQKSNPSELSPSRSGASSFVSILTTWGQGYLKTHHFPAHLPFHHHSLRNPLSPLPFIPFP